jgi:non-specific serine/threonine protein kinase
MIGITISHYQILSKLGEGGMGVVYLAEDLKLKRRVAIKFLPKNLVSDQSARKMFINEAINASALDHPAICTVHEISETEDGRQYIVMTYYEGETLQKKIEKTKLEVHEVLDYAIQISKGLTKAHSAGIVHRDIKPANILITNDGQVKILDFGLAKLIGQKQKHKEITSEGTLTYMSPEQINGITIDDRTDIWSLGVLIYEMLSSRFPFKGEYEQAIIYSILNEEPNQLRSLNSKIPTLLDDIVSKSLAKDPNKRYQHMIEMRNALENCASDLDHHADKTKKKSKFRLGKRHIIPISISTLIIILLTIFWPQVERPEFRSVLILPFKDLNPTDSLAYFSDGMSEDIITRCAKIRNLRVLSRKASMYYKNSEITLESIGRGAGVSHILEGTVRRDKSQIRISVQLKEIDTGEVLWAESYQRELHDIFTIQSNVAIRIAQALEINLDLQDKERLNQTISVNLPAYDYYIRGRAYYYRYERGDLDSAITLFRKSLKEDKKYALAHAGLADAFSQLTLRFGLEPAWLDSAMNHCEIAIQLEPDLAEAYKALGVIYYTRSQFQASLESNHKALVLNPNHAPAMGNLGWTYLNIGDLKSAHYWLHQAISRSPVNPTITFGLGLLDLHMDDRINSLNWFETTSVLKEDYKPNPSIGQIMIHLLNGMESEAVDYFKNTVKTIKSDAGLYVAGGDAALAMGDPRQAADYYQSALKLDPSCWHPISGINATTSFGFILWKMGHQEEAHQMFQLSEQMNQKMIDMESEWWGNAYDLAAIKSITGEFEESLFWLREAVNKGFRLYMWLEIDPLFENLRQNDTFVQLLQELNSDLQSIKQDISSAQGE